jgi:hypothetical protein
MCHICIALLLNIQTTDTISTDIQFKSLSSAKSGVSTKGVTVYCFTNESWALTRYRGMDFKWFFFIYFYFFIR